MGVAWAGSGDEFQEFIDRHGLTFPQISDAEAEVFGRFGVASQPAIAIVTPSGEVQTILGAADEEIVDGVIEDALAG